MPSRHKSKPVKHPPTTRPRGAPSDADDLMIMEVAHLLGVRYLRARDLMLTGQCGPTKLNGRQLTARRDGVVALKQRMFGSA